MNTTQTTAIVREFTAERRAQGFRSQGHLNAFLAYSDHRATCAECQRDGEPFLGDDGWQPTARECDVAKALYKTAAKEGGYR